MGNNLFQSSISLITRRKDSDIFFKTLKTLFCCLLPTDPMRSKASQEWNPNLIAKPIKVFGQAYRI